MTANAVAINRSEGIVVAFSRAGPDPARGLRLSWTAGGWHSMGRRKNGCPPTNHGEALGGLRSIISVVLPPKLSHIAGRPLPGSVPKDRHPHADGSHHEKYG